MQMGCMYFAIKSLRAPPGLKCGMLGSTNHGNTQNYTKTEQNLNLSFMSRVKIQVPVDEIVFKDRHSSYTIKHGVTKLENIFNYEA